MITTEILDQLEFSKVLSHLATNALTENGKYFLLETRPFISSDLAIKEGGYVSDAKEILIQNDIPPFEYIPDLNEALSRSKIEGTLLKERQILAILSLAEVSRKTYNFLSQTENDSNLKNDFKNRLYVDRNFENRIKKTFTDSGDLADSASVELKSIRREIISKGEQLRKVVGKVLRVLSDSYLVQEEYTTQRDGRIVIPIKAEHKRHVRGFIHSESATGQTVYIEPEETLELNNDILSLHFAERREIERILKNITKSIGDVSESLRGSLAIIARLDAIFAKAKYSIEVIGAFPTFDNNKAIELMDARHPVLIKKLGRKNTVPLSVKIKKNFVVLITGPNAGGKTVVLKTLGLTNIMAQSGMHVPVHPDSNFHWFDDILIDIGDKQSIEDDLSTFSSHLSNINDILSTADENSLILLDEIGTGTDPAEGSALAMAILLQLRDKGSLVFATTHHGNMKLHANQLERFENSSMEFDSENLIPTYKFHQGLPGSSYAFEVAERIGFGKDIIELSKKYLDTGKSKVEEFLLELETKSNNLQTKLNKLEIENSRLKGLSNLYEKKVTALEQHKKEIIEKTKKQADEYLVDVNRKVEKTIKNIKESQASKEVIKKEKDKILEIKNTHKKKFIKVETTSIPKNVKFEVGDFVSVAETSTSGEIIEINSAKKMATIAVGSIKIQVKLNKLISAKRTKQVEKSEGFQYFSSGSASYTLDIRGQKPEEAEYEVVRFLDDSYASNNQRIEVLHGKGTGVLKNMVHELLKNHDQVKKHYFAKVEYGGEGITIVELF